MTSLQFPKGFMWGAATSSHQIEGDNDKNDWWHWELKGKAKDPSGKACDSYHRYEVDFDLAKSLHHNSHRFSIEWSRVEPEEGRWDEEALAHYQKVVQALRERNIEPLVTLHHFTNPQWLSEIGDWENPKTVEFFVRYCQKVVERLGSGVRFWMTINEPLVYIFNGYLVAFWPPGKASLLSAMKVVSHMAEAHGRVYDSIHVIYQKASWEKPQVGLAHAMQVAEAAQPNPFLLNHLSAALRGMLNNRLFMRLVFHSPLYFPAYFFGMGGAQRKLDFIGLNYYFRELISTPFSKGLKGFVVGDVSKTDARHQRARHSDLDWEIYPKGIYQMLKWLGQFKLPVIITENGICTQNDDLRSDYITEHLKEIHHAIQDGVDVRGYQYWSLLDNFEWAFGYDPQFGLIAVDSKTFERRIKNSAKHYAKVCQTNCLSS